MSKEAKSETKTEKSPAKGTPLTAIEDRLNQEQSQGFRGIEVDKTPNEAYTVAGVTRGAPTPETDADLAREVRMDTGLGLSPLEASAREKEQESKNAKK